MSERQVRDVARTGGRRNAGLGPASRRATMIRVPEAQPHRVGVRSKGRGRSAPAQVEDPTGATVIKPGGRGRWRRSSGQRRSSRRPVIPASAPAPSASHRAPERAWRAAPSGGPEGRGLGTPRAPPAGLGCPRSRRRERGQQAARTPRPSGPSDRQADVLHLHVILHPVARAFAAKAGLLDAAKGRHFGRDQAGVHADHPVFEGFLHPGDAAMSRA